MPTTFRLAVNSGLGYTDLFPKTSVNGIIGANDIYEITSLQVEIPATNENIQTVAIATDSKMENAMFDMYLESSGGTSATDFATIDQAQVTTNQLTLVRLGDMPQNPINVTLVFYKVRGAV